MMLQQLVQLSKSCFKMKLAIILLNFICIDLTIETETTISSNPPGWEKFANLKMEDELTDEFEPVKYSYEPPATNNIISSVLFRGKKYGGTFGLHICTFRPCDCYIGSCFAYCAWHWCYRNQDRFNQRFFLQCDTNLDSWQCTDFDYPCIRFC